MDKELTPETDEDAILISAGLIAHLYKFGPAIQAYIWLHAKKEFNGPRAGKVEFKVADMADELRISIRLANKYIKDLVDIRMIKILHKASNQHKPNIIQIVKNKQAHHFKRIKTIREECLEKDSMSGEDTTRCLEKNRQGSTTHIPQPDINFPTKKLLGKISSKEDLKLLSQTIYDDEDAVREEDLRRQLNTNIYLDKVLSTKTNDIYNTKLDITDNKKDFLYNILRDKSSTKSNESYVTFSEKGVWGENSFVTDEKENTTSKPTQEIPEWRKAIELEVKKLDTDSIVKKSWKKIKKSTIQKNMETRIESMEAIFRQWNKSVAPIRLVNITRMRAVADALDHYEVNQIISSLCVYGNVLKRPDTYYSYLHKIEDFFDLGRGFVDRFLDTKENDYVKHRDSKGPSKHRKHFEDSEYRKEDW